MAAEARRETRQGAEGDEEGDGRGARRRGTRQRARRIISLRNTYICILSRKALSFVPRSYLEKRTAGMKLKLMLGAGSLGRWVELSSVIVDWSCTVHSACFASEVFHSMSEL